MLNHISDDILNQLIIEDVPINYKKCVVMYSLGLSIDSIANIMNIKPITVYKSLNTVKEIAVIGRINELRSIVIARLFILFLNKI